MASKPKFDKAASAKRAAEALFHADAAERSSAEFKLAFTKEIASAKRAGIDKWGGARYPGSYGHGFFQDLTTCLWPKKDGVVLSNEQIGDDTLKALVKRRENLMGVAVICFEKEIMLTHLHAKRLKEDTQLDLFTGNVKGSDAKSNEEPKTKGAQATKTEKHLGYALATLLTHSEATKFFASLSVELRKLKPEVLDGVQLQKSIIKIGIEQKLIMDKGGEIRKTGK